VTHRAPEINAEWRKQITNFLSYMRDRGHRWHWLIFGQIAVPVGMIVEPDSHHNDNHRGSTA
jgi:hypothetical protein